MAMNHIKLQSGTWRAKTPVAIYRMQGNREVDYTEYQEGHVFEVPPHVNGFWHALARSDFDDITPDVEMIPAAE